MRARSLAEALRRFPIQRTRNGVKVMVWGAISSFGKKALVFLDGNITANSYKTMLQEQLSANFPELVDGELIFQQDNAPAHAAKLVKSYLKNEGIFTLPWPAQSPDLNIIENLWGIIKSRLNGAYESVDALKEDIIREWEAIEIPLLTKLYESMPSRLKDVLRNKGGPIDY